jgi:hypothetical protein
MARARRRLLAPLLALLAFLAAPVRMAVADAAARASPLAMAVVPGAATTVPASRRRRFGLDDEHANTSIISGVVVFGIGLIVFVFMAIVLLNFYPSLTSATATAAADPNSTDGANNSLDLLPLIFVIGVVLLGLATMFAGLVMIIKSVRGFGK